MIVVQEFSVVTPCTEEDLDDVEVRLSGGTAGPQRQEGFRRVLLCARVGAAALAALQQSRDRPSALDDQGPPTEPGRCGH